MDNDAGFREAFRALTGNDDPLPWQDALFAKFVTGDFVSCRTCTLPTGLGKTSIIALWLIALARRPDLVPRRLVYVVNRRTVVDQTTDEVLKYRLRLLDPQSPPGIVELRERLTALCAFMPDQFPAMSTDGPGNWSPLAISTLRGQFADNQEWSLDPARPAVICGTVDMLGSRLLFSGYRIGFKSRPHHAGLLGQDTLLVHDEAHLEPAFQHLLERVVEEQHSQRTGDSDKSRRLKVIELSATTRTANSSFGLQPADLEHKVVRQRIHAPKRLTLHPVADDKKTATALIDLATKHRDSGTAVLVYARTVATVEEIAKALSKVASGRVETLTGTMRGFERDELVRKPVFMRFLPDAHRQQGSSPKPTCFLVSTSAGEVGVNISADHLVCDLTTFESMAQRFGRVNRFGKRTDTRIDVVHPTLTAFDEKDPLTQARKNMLALLHRLNGDASPQALSDLPAASRAAAFSPAPEILPTSDILFDTWSFTTIKDKLPGRPHVEQYLRGVPIGVELSETQFAWREEVGVIRGTLLDEYPPQELLDEYPLKPHEILKESSYRAFKHLQRMAERCPDDVAWLLDGSGKFIDPPVTLRELASRDRKDRIEGLTVLLSPDSGGLSPQGMLDGTSSIATDVADNLAIPGDSALPQRTRIRNDDSTPKPGAAPRHLRLIWTIDTSPDADADDEDEDEDTEPTNGRFWHWFEIPREGDRSGKKPVEWRVHVDDVRKRIAALVVALKLPEDMQAAFDFAARSHDHGKRRRQFQTMLGNLRYPDLLLAKSGRRGGRMKETYRHEFGSLLDVLSPQGQDYAELNRFTPELQDLALHLIAAHHGRARPHFPSPDEDFDPAPPDGVVEEDITVEVARRFARLQRRYGRWGLAYLESLLRAADWHASAAPSAELDEDALVPAEPIAQEVAS